MFSARFEDALQNATDEELYHFFSEFPSAFRGRLINILSELEAQTVQHVINSVDPPEAAFDDLIWPSEPEQAASQPEEDADEEVPSTSPESWGIFGAPVRPAPSALFGGSENPSPARPCAVPPLPISRSDSSLPFLALTRHPCTYCSLREISTLTPPCLHSRPAQFRIPSPLPFLRSRGAPGFRPSRLSLTCLLAVQLCPLRPECLRRQVHLAVVRGIRVDMEPADAMSMASRATVPVTIRLAQVSARGRMIPCGVPGTGITLVTPVTPLAGEGKSVCQ